MVVTVSITRLNTRLLQPCFMVVTTLNYNLVAPFVISVWVGLNNHPLGQRIGVAIDYTC